MLRRFLAGLALALLVAVPVSAVRQEYTITLDQPAIAGSEVTFTITRTVGRITAQTDWLAMDCYDGSVEVSDTETPVLWGTTTSLVGHTQPLPVAGTWCYATVTQSLDYEPKGQDPVLYFTVG